jgi:hypothetical protein
MHHVMHIAPNDMAHDYDSGAQLTRPVVYEPLS